MIKNHGLELEKHSKHRLCSLAGAGKGIRTVFGVLNFFYEILKPSLKNKFKREQICENSQISVNNSDFGQINDDNTALLLSGNNYIVLILSW